MLIKWDFNESSSVSILNVFYLNFSRPSYSLCNSKCNYCYWLHVCWRNVFRCIYWRSSASFYLYWSLSIHTIYDKVGENRYQISSDGYMDWQVSGYWKIKTSGDICIDCKFKVLFYIFLLFYHNDSYHL